MVDFLIVGAQKCGTTSLHRYLSAHPEIEMPPNKELDFFSNDKYFSLGVNYYRKFFRCLDDPNILCGEASPQYMYTNIAPRRIKETFPNARLIMCLRDPVERAISHLRMNRRRKKETRSLAEAFRDFQEGRDPKGDDIEFRYFYLGEYGRILASYLEYFDFDQIIIVHSHDLLVHRKVELDRILEFLGKKNIIPESAFRTEYHKAGRQRFVLVDRGIKAFASFSPKLNNAIKSIVGADRVYALLHKVETQWNIIPDSQQRDEEIHPSIIRDIREYYSEDEKLFETLAGYRLPWAYERDHS